MDNRRMGALAFISMGGASLPACPGSEPSNRSYAHVEEWQWSEEQLREGLLTGGLKGPMHYGSWAIWQSNAGQYTGELIQYRSVTEKFEDVSFEEALAKAVEWAENCQG